MDQPFLPEGSEGDAAVVRGNAGRKRDLAEVSDGVLALAVIVHGPDFLRAGARGDEVDLGFRDAVEPAAEAQDDLVGEAVGDKAGVVLRGGLAVLFAEDGRGVGVLGVNQEAGDGELATVDGKRTQGKHGGVRWGRRPLAEIGFLRGAGGGWRREALRDHVEDAGIRKVVEEGGVEGGLEAGCLRVGGVGLEVRGSEADLLDAEVGAGADPILRLGGR